MAIRVYGVRNVGKVMEGMWEILAVEKAHSYMILGPNYSRSKRNLERIIELMM